MRAMMFRWATVLIVVQASRVAAIAAPPSEGERADASAIHVDRCRVQLIDHVVLACQRPGVLEFIEPREGDTVEKGQVVARLASEVAEANLAIAERKASSDVDRRYAKKAIEYAEAEHEKSEQINQKFKASPVYPEIEMKRLKLAVDKTRLMAEQAENEAAMNDLSFKQQKAELKTYRVVAPFSGRVNRLFRSAGESVAAGDPVLQLVNLDRVRVEGFVGVREGLKLRPGSKVRVQLDLPDVEIAEEAEVLHGKLVFIDSGVELVSNQMRIWAEIPNPRHILRDGLQAKMTIMCEDIAAAR